MQHRLRHSGGLGERIGAGKSSGGGWSSPLQPLGGETPSLWIKSRSKNKLTDTISGNDATILTQVAALDDTQSLTISPAHIFTTNSFAIEWYANMAANHTKVIVRQGSGTTAAPGYEIGRTHLRLASAASQFVNNDPLINAIGQGWVHIFIFINRKGNLYVYRNGIQTYTKDISASQAESITNAVGNTMFVGSGVNNALLAYYRVYDFGATVPAGIVTNIQSYALSNYQNHDVNANLLSSCIGDYNAIDDPSRVNIYLNTVSDTDSYLKFTAATSVVRTYNDQGSLYNLQYGFQLCKRADAKDRYVPLLRNGNNRTNYSTFLTSPVYQYVKNIAGITTKGNINDYRIRFVQAFFDRSNATIWNDVARAVIFAKINLSGTNGTASVSFNGLAKTATFSSSLSTTVTNWINANYAAYKAIGVNVYPNLNAIIAECDEGTTITEASITNLTLTLNGTVTTSGHYDSTDPKVFHISELNQRILISYLNVGYRGMFYVKFSSYLKTAYYASVEDIYKVSLDELFLYPSDKTLTDNEKALTYTGDIKAAVLAGSAVTYVNNYVKIGILSSTKPMFMLRFDDGFPSYTDWHTLLSSYGVVGTINITCGNDPVNTLGGLSWANLITWHNEGWELTGTSMNDEDMMSPLLTPTEVDTNMQAIIAMILLRTGVTIQHFVPNKMGQENLAVRDVAKKYFKTSHAGAYLAPEGANPLQIDLWNMSAMRGDGTVVTYPFTFEEAGAVALIEAQLDIAKAQNRFAILYIHAATAPYLIKMEAIIQYAQAIGIEFVTTEQAYNNFKYV
jgi:hypothetical protein